MRVIRLPFGQHVEPRPGLLQGGFIHVDADHIQPAMHVQAMDVAALAAAKVKHAVPALESQVFETGSQH